MAKGTVVIIVHNNYSLQDFFLNLVVGIIAAGGVMLDLILAIIEPASVIIWVAFVSCL